MACERLYLMYVGVGLCGRHWVGCGRVEALRQGTAGDRQRLETLGKTVDDAATRLATLSRQPCLPFLLERQTNINVYQV
jgi:hypothetical protein